MKSLWQRLGIISFWLLSPILYFYLRLNARSRVIIKVEDEVLLVKPWLGTGAWEFPGGGIKINETAKAGAIRETYEETGIKLKANSLEKIARVKGRGFIPPLVVCFYAELKYPPEVKKQFVEIIDIAWIKIDDLQNYPLGSFSQMCLDLWKTRR